MRTTEKRMRKLVGGFDISPLKVSLSGNLSTVALYCVSGSKIATDG